MKFEYEDFIFTSDFDSGNLDKVEFVEPQAQVVEENSASTSETPNLPSLLPNRLIRRQKSNPDSPINSPVQSKKFPLKKRSFYSKLKTTVSSEAVCSGQNQSLKEFNLWTKPDCSGTTCQTSFRTWFYFGVKCGSPGSVVKLNVMNLNRQGKLYFHGMKPVFKIVPSKEGFKRIPGKVDFRCSTEGNFIISFHYTFPFERDTITYFAFTYPFSYSECQNMLDEIDTKLGSSLYLTKSNKPADNAVYYSRELVCHSLDGNKIELLTVTSCKGLTMEREANLPDLFPDVNKPRCHIFQNKKVVFISSRVHPGETPASFVFNGILHYLISSKDTIANRLRNLFIFKFIPMLNPDGVKRGHYRADTQGLNLNRIYMVASLKEHPSIYAARTLLLHYHTLYSTPDSNLKGTVRKNMTFRSGTDIKSIRKTKGLSEGFRTMAHAPDGTNSVSKTKGLSNERLAFRTVGHNSKMSLSKRLSSQGINNIQRKVPPRKHSLHTCETLTKNLTFLSSVPVLPMVPKGSDVQSNSNIQDGSVLNKTYIHLSPSSSSLVVDGHQTTLESPRNSFDACNECALSEYPSKKITLESCSCIEASDADDSSSVGCEARLGEGDASKLLEHVPCIKPEESGISFYFDLHGHASKRGCFIYGNYFPDVDKMVDCMFLPKLMSLNCPYFDFSSCNFSAENMYSGSNSNVQSKEGSGRVSLYVLTGIIHSYTMECNYNTCRFTSNQKGNKNANTNVPSQVFFTPEIYEQIGESLLVSILDAVGHNPRSQVSSSQFLSIQGVKEWLKQHAMSLRGRCVSSFAKKLAPVVGARSSEKVATRSMTIRRSLFSSANKGLKLESSSTTANSPVSPDRPAAPAVRTRSRLIRGTRSLLSSPVSASKTLLQRRHTFVQEAAIKYKGFRKPKAPRSSTA